MRHRPLDVLIVLIALIAQKVQKVQKESKLLSSQTVDKAPSCEGAFLVS